MKTQLPETLNNIRPALGLNGWGIYTIGELMAADIPPVRQIIESLIPEKKNVIISGAYAAGKTTLAIQLSYAMATGEPFFGRKVNMSYQVGYFDLELGQGEFKERARLAMPEFLDSGIINEKFCYFDATAETPLCGRLKFEKSNVKFIAELLNHLKIQVLFIDNISLVFSGEMESSRDCLHFVERLNDIRSLCPSLCSVVVLNHLVKPDLAVKQPSLLTDPRGWLGLSRGSGKLHDHITVRLGLSRETTEAGDEFYVLGGISSHAQVQPVILEQNPETRQFSRHSGDDLKIQLIFTKKELEAWNALPVEFKFSHIKNMGKMRSSAQRAFKAACANGLLKEVNRGTWAKVPRN